MAQRDIDRPEQVPKFAPKDKAHTEGSRLDEAGRAIVTQIQRAAALANENCERAMNLAHRVSMELSASEDRTHQLKSEIEMWHDRAERAERWLQAIQTEIEEKLIARSGEKEISPR